MVGRALVSEVGSGDSRTCPMSVGGSEHRSGTKASARSAITVPPLRRNFSGPFSFDSVSLCTHSQIDVGHWTAFFRITSKFRSSIFYVNKPWHEYLLRCLGLLDQMLQLLKSPIRHTFLLSMVMPLTGPSTGRLPSVPSRALTISL